MSGLANIFAMGRFVPFTWVFSIYASSLAAGRTLGLFVAPKAEAFAMQALSIRPSLQMYAVLLFFFSFLPFTASVFLLIAFGMGLGLIYLIVGFERAFVQ